MRAPIEVGGLGVPPSLVEDLFMRRVLIEREVAIRNVAEAMGITMPIAKELAEDLRNKKMLEYYGLDGRDYVVGLTEQGRSTAVERMQQSTYASTVPVALADYVRIIEAQKAELILNRENVKNAFADLVVSDELLDQLGPAFMNDGAIFMYGPPGTGKTSLAERMIRIHGDWILVPRAVEVDGQVIQVFDPAVHDEAEAQPEDLDPRWVVCRRPVIVAGGELSMSMLELEFDQAAGLYQAPIQMKSNNGILVIDDFGRQMISPDELLNRWIVPLGRGIDYLKLSYGFKFTVPFECKLVFSTNLDPNSLGDDAFLRRLRNKVFVGPITDEAFTWILARVAKAKGIQVSAEAGLYMRQLARKYIGELRPYLAIDFCELMLGICAYEGVPKVFDEAMIDRVADVYFVDPDLQMGPTAANSGAAPAVSPATV
ncbi:MAG: AAA family ATPase [Acidimicrobiales bacterium]|nr:AAA family ATPase [Acidimicrobiales bacterium]